MWSDATEIYTVYVDRNLFKYVDRNVGEMLENQSVLFRRPSDDLVFKNMDAISTRMYLSGLN